MIPPWPPDPQARAARKADLLLASVVLRGQAVDAANVLGRRADGVARWAVRARRWLADPAVWAAVATGLAWVRRRRSPRQGRSRPRLWQGMRWAWMAWRFWRSAR